MRRSLRLMRYVSVGATCALVNNAIVIGLDQIGIHYVVGMMTAFVVVVCLGFALHITVTFGVPPTGAGFLRYGLAMASSAVLGTVILALLKSGMGIPVPIASPITTVVLTLWTYAASRWAFVPRLQFNPTRLTS